jgi:hypothetical protein
MGETLLFGKGKSSSNSSSFQRRKLQKVIGGCETEKVSRESESIAEKRELQ